MLTKDDVKTIIDECKNNDDMTVECACEVLALVHVIETDIDKLAEIYTSFIVKNNMNEEFDAYITDRIRSIGEELDHLFSLNRIIKQMRPDGDFSNVDMTINYITGKYDMFKNNIDTTNNIRELNKFNDIDVVI